MDENSYQVWSDKLVELRKTRVNKLKRRHSEKGDDFTIEDFTVEAIASLEQILDQWFTIQERSFENVTQAEIDAAKAELESVIEFELEALKRDLRDLVGESKWDESIFTQGEDKISAVAEELKNRYLLKINNMKNTKKKDLVADLGTATPANYSSHTGGSGVAVIGMFLFGLVIGAGPSVYYWDASRKEQKKFEEERTKILADQRALQDGVALFQEQFDQLASGQIKNIPMLEREVAQIRSETIQRRQAVESEYQRSRERLIKRQRAGEQLDQSLDRLSRQKEEKLTEIKAKESSQLESIEKQITVLKELRSR